MQKILLPVLAVSIMLTALFVSTARAVAVMPSGSQSLGPSDTTVTLDTPPPGATQLVLTVDYTATVNSYCIENVDVVAQPAASRLTTGYSLNDPAAGTAGIGLVQDRAYTYQPGAYSAFDGTLDFAGTSGGCVSAVKNKSNGATYTFTTAPTTLTFVRRNQNDANGTVAVSWDVDHTAVVYWSWQ